MEWTAEAILKRLEEDPSLRVRDLLRDRALAVSSMKKATLEFQVYASDPKYADRFQAVLSREQQENGGGLTYGLTEPDPTDRKAFWIWSYLRTLSQNRACAAAGVTAREVQRWFTPGHPDYDEGFTEQYREAAQRVVMACEDDIHEARAIAKSIGDGKTLAMIATRALESLNSARWGRSRLEITGQVNHVHALPAATAAQLAARSQRLLGGGEDEVIDVESEEVPS